MIKYATLATLAVTAITLKGFAYTFAAASGYIHGVAQGLGNSLDPNAQKAVHSAVEHFHKTTKDWN